MTNSVTLYFTDGCHLCELAAELLDQLTVTFHHQDIIDSPDLVARYGTTIPVVRKSDGTELNWPFDAAQLTKFLE